jgi:serine/threonine-protein kinase
MESELDTAAEILERELFVQRELDTSAAPLGRRFVQEMLLTTGGMGQVYKGRDLRTGQPVAIKRLRPELAANHPELVKRFIREGEVLRQLNHPNIVKVLATFEIENQPVIVMEYMAGGSLRDLLEQQPKLPLERLLNIGLELADALARVHHLNIIHRDLKPANVLLARDGAPRLTDFGVAYLVSQETRLTQVGEILGTTVYMSPEAWRGEPLDVRSDIWSFGAVLYEMVAGRPPFAAEHAAAIMTAILNDPLPDLYRFRPEAPPALVELLKLMLVKERDLRIDSMRQVAAGLEVIQRDLSG